MCDNPPNSVSRPEKRFEKKASKMQETPLLQDCVLSWPWMKSAPAWGRSSQPANSTDALPYFVMILNMMMMMMSFSLLGTLGLSNLCVMKRWNFSVTVPTCVKRKTTLKQMENVIFRTPSVKLQCKGTSNVVIRFSARLYKYEGNPPPLRTARDIQVKCNNFKSAVHELNLGSPAVVFKNYFLPSCLLLMLSCFWSCFK